MNTTVDRYKQARRELFEGVEQILFLMLDDDIAEKSDEDAVLLTEQRLGALLLQIDNLKRNGR